MKGSYIFEKLLDTFRGQQEQINDRVWNQANALSTWLILGNAGALVLVLNVYGSGTFCSPETLKFSALCFAVGLVLTFAGLGLGFAGSLWASMKLADMGNEVQGAWIAQGFIDDLEDQEIDVPEDNPLNVSIQEHQRNLEAGQRRLRRGFIVAGVATVLMVGGAVSFSVGILKPLMMGNPFVQCSVTTLSANSTPGTSLDVRR